MLSSGLEHYLRSGEAEHRNPSASFDEQYYLAHNPDVATAVQSNRFNSGYEHYLLAGRAEGRPAHA